MNTVQTQFGKIPTLDFGTRRVWLHLEPAGESLRLIIYPFLPQFIKCYEQWNDKWVVFKIVERERNGEVISEKEVIGRFGEESPWTHKPPFVEFFDVKPTVSDAKPFLRIEPSGEWGFFTGNKPLISGLFYHALSSQIVSQQVCPPGEVEDYVRHLSLLDVSEMDLFYWGYRQERKDSLEFVYLLSDERLQRPEYTTNDNWYIQCVKPYYHFEWLECLVLSRRGVRKENFADVYDKVVEPVMPGPLYVPDYFCLKVRETGVGYYWRGEQQFVRNLIDFLNPSSDSEIFYRQLIGDEELEDWRKDKISEFKKTGIYLRYDDIWSNNCPLAEYALLHEDVHLDGLPSDLEWVRERILSGNHNYPALGLRAYGKFWDDDQIETYISNQEDVVTMLRYTILSLFMRAFEYFPNDCPDSDFGEELLSHIIEESVDIYLEFPLHFSREGGLYRMAICRTPHNEDVPKSAQRTIQYSAGEWEISR